MNLFRKMERKFGRYAIHNLMYYIIILYGIGIAVDFFSRTVGINIYSSFLSLNAGAILHGQIWRLITFLIYPPVQSGFGNPFIGYLFCFLVMYMYYSIGTTLERIWGAFRFNVYIFMGVLGHILAAFILYLVTSQSWPLTTYYLNLSLFLAFAVTFPDAQFYLYVIPVKAKWMAAFFGLDFLYSFVTGGMVIRCEIALSLLNFFVFFLMTRNYNKINPKEIRRKQEFKQQVNKVTKITHHKCAVCGRTEKDDPNLEFRFCSKCDGDYEYCMDHLYTHKHVTKED